MFITHPEQEAHSCFWPTCVCKSETLWILVRDTLLMDVWRRGHQFSCIPSWTHLDSSADQSHEGGHTRPCSGGGKKLQVYSLKCPFFDQIGRQSVSV